MERESVSLATNIATMAEENRSRKFSFSLTSEIKAKVTPNWYFLASKISGKESNYRIIDQG